MLSLFKFARLYVFAIPLLLIILGGASNQLVLIANHDTFPVMLNDVRASGHTFMLDSEHCVMTTHTHLNVLADIFDFGTETDSIGDLLLTVGEYLWNYAYLVWAMLILGDLFRARALLEVDM